MNFQRLLIITLLFFTSFNPAFAETLSEWQIRALALQNHVDDNAPINEALFIGTHNSYNSKAYQSSRFPYFDPNQTLSITEQLNSGVRSIELDLHWTRYTTLTKEILLCHGYENHIGCSPWNRRFIDALDEIKNWLIKNPNEVILLYLERHLNGHENEMLQQLQTSIGDYIFKTSLSSDKQNPRCTSLPSQLSKADVLKAGKQVIIITKGCESINMNSANHSWTDYVFTGSGMITGYIHNFIDRTLSSYEGFPVCTIQQLFAEDKTHSSLWRIYEDKTTLGNLFYEHKQITAEDMREMIRCHINWPALDMLENNDSRLIATIWSWAPFYPKLIAGNCGLYEKFNGIVNTQCERKIAAYACRNGNTENHYKVVNYLGDWSEGEKACQTLGAEWHFAMPKNGFQLNVLRQQMIKGQKQIWLNYTFQNGKWLTG